MSGKTKHIFVTGGVVSGLGKGITAASLGRLLKERGYRVTNQKFDPYLNVDPGAMSPLQHGEVFVTEDGAETDLDLGHYERFTDENLSINSSITSGKIYWEVLNRERQGDYSSATVQIIPHVTNEIKERIKRVSNDVDIAITEIGGTVGDIESLPFLEAIRQFSLDVGHENCMFIHVTLIPYIIGSHELKSKPTQHSVKELQSLGIRPNVLVCRSEYPIPADMRAKISMFCDVRPEDIIQNLTVDTIYGVPLMLEEEGLAAAVCHHLGLVDSHPDLKEWRAMVEQIQHSSDVLNVAIVGKYIELHDAYLSVIECLNHAGFTRRYRVNCLWVDAEQVNAQTAADLLGEAHGILVPGGSGSPGIEGKIEAVRYAREQGVPFFGICLGLQVAAIEFARNKLGLAQANSAEFNPDTPEPVIHLIDSSGDSVRRGAYPCLLADGSVARAAYGSNEISERHCHRYEFNNTYREAFAAAGMRFTGLSPDGRLVEVMELTGHPWFVGVQFHPEFKGRPNRPHPLFTSFVDAAIDHKTK